MLEGGEVGGGPEEGGPMKLGRSGGRVGSRGRGGRVLVLLRGSGGGWGGHGVGPFWEERSRIHTIAGLMRSRR